MMENKSGNKINFRAILHQSGKTATGFMVPEEVVERLGAGKRPPVRVSIGDYTYRNTVAPMGGKFWIGVSAEHRAGSGVKAGDDLDVSLELDTEPREVTVPPDLKQALESNTAVRDRFESLSYSNKRRIVLQVEGAKTPETRQRRIDKALAELHEAGKKA